MFVVYTKEIFLCKKISVYVLVHSSSGLFIFSYSLESV